MIPHSSPLRGGPIHRSDGSAYRQSSEHPHRRRRVRSLLATLGVLITLIAAVGAQPAAAERGHNNPKPTIVLVHRAWPMRRRGTR